jgi:hypothetical protein
MKKIFLSTSLAVLLFAGYSCKGKDKTTDATTTPTVQPVEPPAATTPVEVNNDEALSKGVTDATKDIKGLQARVENGVIYLSGSISREDNMRITPTLNSLHPKQINRDNLTVK